MGFGGSLGSLGFGGWGFHPRRVRTEVLLLRGEGRGTATCGRPDGATGVPFSVWGVSLFKCVY